MKAEELMIGDWLEAEVQVDDTGKEPIFSKLRKRVTSVYKLGRSVDFELEDRARFGASISPILLTPEILEENGFKKDIELNGCYWRPDCRRYCIVKETDTWYFAFRHMGGGHICISECNYVHELQHALRLCSVEKEIEL